MGICCSQFGVCGQHQLRGELQNRDLSRVKCLLALAHKEDLFPVGKVASTAPISFFFFVRFISTMQNSFQIRHEGQKRLLSSA